MTFLKHIVLFVGSLGLCASLFAKEIVISIERDILEMSNRYLDGKSISEFEDFTSPYCQRDIVEFIVVQKALYEGGFKHRFHFEPGNFDARNTRLLLSGDLLLSFDTLWSNFALEHQDKLFVSDPVIRKGEFVAGVFVSVKNAKKLKVKTLEDFKQLSLVSSSDWHVDWLTLTAIKPRQLIDEEDWVSMAKLVSKGWVDAMLVSFNNTEPFYYKGPAYKIVALEGVKVALDDSRHFVVSKRHRLGQETYDALQLGLKKLRQRGYITKAYRQCGFFNSAVENWTLLNP